MTAYALRWSPSGQENPKAQAEQDRVTGGRPTIRWGPRVGPHPSARPFLKGLQRRLLLGLRNDQRRAGHHCPTSDQGLYRIQAGGHPGGQDVGRQEGTGIVGEPALKDKGCISVNNQLETGLSH